MVMEDISYLVIPFVFAYRDVRCLRDLVVFFPSASNVLSSIPIEIGSISSLRSLRLGRCRSIFLIIQSYLV